MKLSIDRATRRSYLSKLLHRTESNSANRTSSSHDVNVVDTLDAVSESEWNDIVDRSPRASVFHRYEWLDAVEAGLEYTPKHLVVEKDGNTIGLFPNFVRDLPMTPFRRLSSVFPGLGGPLLPTDLQESLPLVLDAIPDLCSGRTIVHEIRARDPSYLRYHDALRSRGYRPYLGECRHLIDLTNGWDEILADMSRSRRKAIERGRENDYEIVEEEITAANLERFRQTYERVMDRVDGEVYPKRFFQELPKLRDRLLLVTIRIDGEYAGGMLELLDDEQSAVYGFLSAVPEEYFDDNASELLYEYVLRWGIENGYETYDFGSSRPDYDDGLFMYKQGFGGAVVPSLIWERGYSPLWKPVEMGRRKYVAHQR